MKINNRAPFIVCVHVRACMRACVRRSLRLCERARTCQPCVRFTFLFSNLCLVPNNTDEPRSVASLYHWFSMRQLQMIYLPLLFPFHFPSKGEAAMTEHETGWNQFSWLKTAAFLSSRRRFPAPGVKRTVQLTRQCVRIDFMFLLIAENKKAAVETIRPH